MFYFLADFRVLKFYKRHLLFSVNLRTSGPPIVRFLSYYAFTEQIYSNLTKRKCCLYLDDLDVLPVLQHEVVPLLPPVLHHLTVPLVGQVQLTLQVLEPG